MVKPKISVGIIGLSVHSADFTEILNAVDTEAEGYNSKVVAIYHPKGNPDVEFSEDQLQNFADRISKQGVSMVNSIEEVIEMSDAVMLLTNDGRPHLEQVLPVLKADKPVYIDKPLAENLENVMKLFHEANRYGVKVFSSSALRYGSQNTAIKAGEYVGELLGAQTYGPAPLQKSHVDMYWDGIHGIESLYSVMGTGCQTVSRTSAKGTDLIVGKWPGDKLGYFRGIRMGKVGFGGTVFGTNGINSIGKFEGYQRLVRAIDDFFLTGNLPVAQEETIEIYAFMEAADESKRQGGKPINISDTINRIKI
ncbi:Gfo/Idh/MocA family oxidoreductase [uncultured Cyclobacterium sp.]|uniref:Gfo/Idh/MocA family protein n=1 Tax=uncultured Cyclobacterium sp. TaxID=453820 RepID=UPI0030EB7ADB|tara:strand:+ start:18943 stop:19866 length:924 start_codon:yes stop_codon:yes gene_type:complete